MAHEIGTDHYNFVELQELIGKERIQLSKEAVEKIKTCRDYLDQRLANSDELIYGINTGFGALCNTAISKNELKELQSNLVMSHACGVGEEMPHDIVRLMLLFKILGLSKGYSGIHPATLERLILFYNEGILPVVYQQGSLGASGDLAPLAHLALPLIGKGEVYYKGQRMDSGEMLKALDLEPLQLHSKEGLALLNGTQFMSAYGFWCVQLAKRQLNWADAIAAMSLEGYDGRIEPFEDFIHTVRPHAGQLTTARNVYGILEGSQIAVQEKAHVQDPYSFRCIPQVHGATRDALLFVEHTIIKEINAVTDNPTIFPEADRVISGGNFHGQPMALALDQLAIIMAEIGSISERRTYKLLSGTRGLPAFLVANPGLHSGFMIPQYTAASIVSQNKQWCTPSSVDTIDSSNGQEDHVSMGANAATKSYKVLKNVEKILAIELFTATQALEFRRPLKSSESIEKLFNSYRKVVTFVKQDRELYKDIAESVRFLQEEEAPCMNN